MLFWRIDKQTPTPIAHCMQPIECQPLRFVRKTDGEGKKANLVAIEFDYPSLTGHSVPEAYERLLLDALEVDASFFIRADSIKLTWSIVDLILAQWRYEGSPLWDYDSDMSGPKETMEFLRDQGRSREAGCVIPG